MISRRHLLTGAAALLASPVAAETVVRIPRSYLPHEVDVNPDLIAGRIYVVNATHNLYWTLGNGRAIQYTTALGEAGRAFQGQATVQRKAEWPSWTPTANMIRLEPAVYGPYRNGLPGGHSAIHLGRGHCICTRTAMTPSSASTARRNPGPLVGRFHPAASG